MHQEQLYTASGLHWGKTKWQTLELFLKKPRKVITIIHIVEKSGTEMWLIWKKKLQNISKRNTRYFPRMQSPSKFKPNKPKVIWQSVHLKVRCPQRHLSQWAHRPQEPLCGTAARTRRGIRSSPPVGLAHQTLLTSTNEWNLRFPHSHQSPRWRQPKIREDTRASAALHVLKPYR